MGLVPSPHATNMAGIDLFAVDLGMGLKCAKRGMTTSDILL
jgi:hypothetical protein